MSSADTILANGVEIDAAGIGFLVPTNQIPVSTSLGITDDALILGIPGPRGQDGKPGPAGTNVVSAAIDAGSSLVFTLSDGTTLNVGQVIGPRGVPGLTGRSIRTTSINSNSELILVFDDNTTINVGSVVGPRGPIGITGTGVTRAVVTQSGYLQISLTDGSVFNAGYVVGANGRGVTSATITPGTGQLVIGYSDGTSVIAGITAIPSWQVNPLPWAANTAYTNTAPASTVTYSGSSYVCKISHTSGSTFDASQWYVIAQRGTDGTNGTNGLNGNGYGTVIGPSTSTVNSVVLWSTTDGMYIKDSTVKIGTAAGNIPQLDTNGAIPDAVGSRLTPAMYYFMTL